MRLGGWGVGTVALLCGCGSGLGSASAGTRQHQVSLTVAGSGAIQLSTGQSCRDRCTVAVAEGAQVTATATPDAGLKLSGWSGACSGAGACGFTVGNDLALGVTFGAVGPAPAASRYSVIDVGAIAHPESIYSDVIAFAGGKVVGVRTTQVANDFPRAYWIYDVASGTARDLPPRFVPMSANGKGDLLGSIVHDDKSTALAVLSSGGNLTELSVPAGGWGGINDSGLIFGNSPLDPKTLATAPFLLGPNGAQNLPFKGVSAYATAMNNAGLVVGSSTELNANPQAVVWRDGVSVELGTLNRPGWLSYATVVNDQGLVAGTLQGPTRQRSVFLWDADGMRDIGTPPSCQWVCTPNGMNYWGQIVGQARDEIEPPHYHGWIWRDGAYTPLQDLIDAADITIEVARAIDDDGRIAASGLRPVRGGGLRALLLVPAR